MDELAELIQAAYAERYTAANGGDARDSGAYTRVTHYHVPASAPISRDYLTPQGHLANNLYNRAQYLQRQVSSAYKRSTDENNWYPEQREAIRKINEASAHYNQTRIKTLKSEIKKIEDPEAIVRKQEQITEYEKNPPLVDADHTALSYGKLTSYFAYHKDTEPDYKNMLAQTAQQTLKESAASFSTWRAALADWRSNPQKYKGRPGIPKYRTKGAISGLTYPKQAFKLEWELDGKDDNRVYLSFGKNYGKDMAKKIDLGRTISREEVISKETTIQCVKAVPVHDGWDVQIVVKKKRPKLRALNGRYAGGDLGLNNLITLVSNAVDTRPLIADGGLIKSVNRYYNKETARINSTYNGHYTSRDKKHTYAKRDAQLGDLLGQAANIVIKWLLDNDITLLVLGYSSTWKDDVKLASSTRQSFMHVPFARFRDMLRDKCEERGIAFLTTEESYTSKASLVDLDGLPSFGDAVPDGGWKFSGRRVHRGLYRSSGSFVEGASVSGTEHLGIVLNADVNGAGNILRKVAPEAFGSVSDWRFLMNPAKVRLSLGPIALRPRLSRRASVRVRRERVATKEIA